MDTNELTAVALIENWQFEEIEESNFYEKTFDKVVITVNPIEKTIRVKDKYGNVQLPPYPSLEKFKQIIKLLEMKDSDLNNEPLSDYQVMDIMQLQGKEIKLCAGDDDVLVGSVSVSFMIDNPETIKQLENGKWQAVLVMFNKDEFYKIKNS